MHTDVELLTRYAAYHRDQRNIMSHFVGVPMIVFAIGALLSKPSFSIGGFPVSPAWIVFALSAVWYLTRGSLLLGLAVSLAVGMLVALGQHASGGGMAGWLGWGLSFFVVGWLIQFAGHWYEGKKPAFLNDALGLLVGPMFLTAEILFGLGWNKPLREQIEQRVGPTMLRDLARIA